MEGAMVKILLYGTLRATICGASLPNELLARLRGSKTKSIRKLITQIVAIRNPAPTDVYVTIDLDKVCVERTKNCTSYNESLDPYWFESFHIYCAHLASNMIFTVMLDNPIGASVIGRAYLPVQELLDGEEVQRSLEILDDQVIPVGSRIEVKVQYFDVSRDDNWSRGVCSPKFAGVPYTIFSQRQGCSITLYHESHVPDGLIPNIPLADGNTYEHHRSSEDILDAILKARFLIYIAGWTVNTKITCKRRKHGGVFTLGELLKMKSQEGVRVLMLVWNGWDGSPSVDLQDTMKYFRHSSVYCLRCPRVPDDGSTVQAMFAHHQKIVVVDQEEPTKGSEKRRIVSFVGGMDLCDAYPGHGTHARLEGLVAWDVLHNFEQIWRKHGNEVALLELNRLPFITVPTSTDVFPENKDTWNVQLFRSIDSDSAFHLYSTPGDAERAKHIPGKDGETIDRSIQDAYINAIRRAKNFIYIENQYFLGSSYCWRPEGIRPEGVGALHLIPMELALKVVSKIEAGERFTVYVVVPMWPEGVPDSLFVQAILDWQRRTMEMMYTNIIEALQAKGIDSNPMDYLAFFCLGSRKVKKSGPLEHPEPDVSYAQDQEARRSMIHVHSRMMIVDDEYIIVGSANINQRSMDGARDTEIAIGAYQPYHLCSSQPARGQVHGFRMALWYEHLGMLDDVFLHPESLECVHKVNGIAERYWDMYASNDLEEDLPGHLLSYPVGLTDEGVVAELPGTEFFPDTQARVLGCKSGRIPPVLTT